MAQFGFEKLATKADLARAWGVSPETLRKKLKQVPGLDTGRRKYLYPSELAMVRRHFGFGEGG